MDNAPGQTTWAGRGTPPAEVNVTVELVRDLLSRQHPDLANQSLCWIDAGWDNAIFRLGEHLAVRLPRRAVAARLILHEQLWLPELASILTLPAPIPVRRGTPELGYPWHWSVVPWFSGGASDLNPLSPTQAAPLASFLRSLHVRAPENAPINPVRGVPLIQRRAPVEERMQRLEKETQYITADIRGMWERALVAPIDVEPTWLHGDLHAQNVLVDSGAITAIVDWGDVCRGDRAGDLAAIWTLLPDRSAREEAMRLCGDVSDATWSRARGWAASLGVILLDTGLVGNARHAAMGAQILLRLTEGP
jgi:aminoglycoside phosphotransferase (APT) family kinase protein